MIQRLLFITIIAGGAYWYWTGPYQERVNPTYEQQLLKNSDAMAGCMRAEAYQLGATGQAWHACN